MYYGASPTYVGPYRLPDYSDTARPRSTVGMTCKGKISGLTIDKCFHEGGWVGHRGATGVDRRTYRTYTGPRNKLTYLRKRAGDLLAMNQAAVEQRDRYWKKLKNYGKADNRVQPRTTVSGKKRRGHKENAARYLGFYYRAKAAKAAYNHQQLINVKLAAEAGGVSSTPIHIGPVVKSTTTAPIRVGFEPRFGPVSTDVTGEEEDSGGWTATGPVYEPSDTYEDDTYEDDTYEDDTYEDDYEDIDRTACEDAGMQWLAETRECVAADVAVEEEDMVPEDELPQVNGQEDADLEGEAPILLVPSVYDRYRTPIWLATLGVTGYFIYRYYQRK